MPGIRSQFSKDFIFGAATAAYQIEGSKFGGCGESIWDHFAKNGGTENGDDGSLACGEYGSGRLVDPSEIISQLK